MKTVSIVGARPQFIKAAAVGRILHRRNTDILLHTGQHYDYEMSALFFQELDIREPDINLGIGSGPHGWQTGKMLADIELVLLEERPDWVLVYGDTNSTLSGALAAAKLNIPLAHIEAGLRSFNKQMPEEINRLLTDHMSTLLFCPTVTAAQNLRAEGRATGVYVVGDVMYDAAMFYGTMAEGRSTVLAQLGLTPRKYLLATVHRPRNTDDTERLKSILAAFSEADQPVILPAHPRTAQAMEQASLPVPPNVIVTNPVGYLDMIVLERNARMILTDSGGVQKEAYYHRVPCITLREETEWIETVESGWNVLVGADRQEIARAVRDFRPPSEHPDYYGDGHAADRIVEMLACAERASSGETS
jgi:UDP-N-acetylglucosamine 2-epimerase